MKLITFDNLHRRKHFEFFKNMNHPHFSISANVDITPCLPVLKRNNWPFMPTMVWAASKAANDLAPFRQRIREEVVVEHEVVHPSFAVATEAADVFSFCEVKFTDDFPLFLESALEKMARMKTNPSFEDEPGRDDYLFMSSIPWISFTGVTHAMNFHPHDCVPRIAWGKYFRQGKKTWLPFSVQAHHALVDGRDLCLLFQDFERIVGDLSKP